MTFPYRLPNNDNDDSNNDHVGDDIFPIVRNVMTFVKKTI